MDIRSLACFVAVAEELHFRRAAERVHITQPALSQRIRALEEEVGAALLERDRRQVSLTPAGAAFLEPARAAVANAMLAKSAAQRALRGETGRLRLGFTVIAFYGFLPAAVRVYRSRFPDVSVELTEVNSPSLERALASGELDLGILHPPLEMPSLNHQSLPPQKLVLALPVDHPLAARSTVRVAELRDQPFLIAPRRIGPNIYDRVIAHFRSEGVSPAIIQEATPMTTLIGLVSAGVGLGFVTEGLAAAGRPGVVFLTVEPPPPEVPVAAAWAGDRPSMPAMRFLDVVRELSGGRAPLHS
ncbi:LysR substrate-binding domain-containing protein [Brucella sp. IR073]|uniref:LysR substrate-binding domain-containing protein n=1 Tax=unclassified Brucella TaxID=2632610 RepID=UPI003B9838D5